jgi:hypothetical protein
VTADELRAQYLFGGRDLIRLLGFLAFVVGIYVLVFTHDERVLTFLAGQWSDSAMTKFVVAGVVFLFVPIVAYAYGAVTRSVMKLIKME